MDIESELKHLNDSLFAKSTLISLPSHIKPKTSSPYYNNSLPSPVNKLRASSASTTHRRGNLDTETKNSDSRSGGYSRFPSAGNGLRTRPSTGSSSSGNGSGGSGKQKVTGDINSTSNRLIHFIMEEGSGAGGTGKSSKGVLSRPSTSDGVSRSASGASNTNNSYSQLSTSLSSSSLSSSGNGSSGSGNAATSMGHHSLAATRNSILINQLHLIKANRSESDGNQGTVLSALEEAIAVGIENLPNSSTVSSSAPRAKRFDGGDTPSNSRRTSLDRDDSLMKVTSFDSKDSQDHSLSLALPSNSGSSDNSSNSTVIPNLQNEHAGGFSSTGSSPRVGMSTVPSCNNNELFISSLMANGASTPTSSSSGSTSRPVSGAKNPLLSGSSTPGTGRTSPPQPRRVRFAEPLASYYYEPQHAFLHSSGIAFLSANGAGGAGMMANSSRGGYRILTQRDTKQSNNPSAPPKPILKVPISPFVSAIHLGGTNGSTAVINDIHTMNNTLSNKSISPHVSNSGASTQQLVLTSPILGATGRKSIQGGPIPGLSSSPQISSQQGLPKLLPSSSSSAVIQSVKNMTSQYSSAALSMNPSALPPPGSTPYYGHLRKRPQSASNNNGLIVANNGALVSSASNMAFLPVVNNLMAET
eukprot:scaffold5093_cov179-Ochromonas_danica.AAC.6